MPRRWRSWSPWRLREALRWQRDVLAEDRAASIDATQVERLYRHAVLALAGHPDPFAEAMRYSVDGLTLLIDGDCWSQADDRTLREAARSLDIEAPRQSGRQLQDGTAADGGSK